MRCDMQPYTDNLYDQLMNNKIEHLKRKRKKALRALREAVDDGNDDALFDTIEHVRGTTKELTHAKTLLWNHVYGQRNKSPCDPQMDELVTSIKSRSELESVCRKIAVEEQRKIGAIKVWRAWTGDGLKEAKDAVEELMR